MMNRNGLTQQRQDDKATFVMCWREAKSAQFWLQAKKIITNNKMIVKMYTNNTINVNAYDKK